MTRITAPIATIDLTIEPFRRLNRPPATSMYSEVLTIFWCRRIRATGCVHLVIAVVLRVFVYIVVWHCFTCSICILGSKLRLIALISCILGFFNAMRCKMHSSLQLVVGSNVIENGWGGRDRTCEWRYQKALPYHLATPQHEFRTGKNLAARPPL